MIRGLTRLEGVGLVGELTGRPLDVLAANLARRGYLATVYGGTLVTSLGVRGEQVIACDGRRFRLGGEHGHVLGEVGAESIAADRAVRVLRQIKRTADGRLDVRFLAARTAPGQVRMLVELRLSAWGLARMRNDVTLIASELVSNAVVHASDGGEIRVRFTRAACGVLLAVWDSSDRRPTIRRPLGAVAGDVAPDAAALDPGHDDGTCGRGLPIVAALAAACGVTPTEPIGKWVWARCV